MQHNFKIDERDFIAVGVLGDACNYSIDPNIPWLEFRDSKLIGYTLDLPLNSKYQILFEYPCAEEEAESVVESPMGHYKNYNPKETDYSDLWLKTAKESLASKFEAEGIYTVNPYGEYKYEPYPYSMHNRSAGMPTFEEWEKSYKDLHDQWQQAQERVSEKYLIIEKIKK